MLHFERQDLRTFDFAKADAFADRTIFQTRPWLDFVAATQGAEPVVAALRDGGELVGYFTGLIVCKYGFKILGSPFPGWTTSYMGFNLIPGRSRSEALAGLRAFAFKELGCVHAEVYDRWATTEDARASGLEHGLGQSYELDLRPTEEALLAGMQKGCRGYIKQAEKLGVTIEEASDAGFADDYCAQLQDVFAKQSLVPTYEIKRVRALIEHLLPTGNLLLLRARDAQGRCIATALFPAFNTHMYFWGAASWRAHQNQRPNEIIIWHAMRYWKKRGVSFFEMMGRRDYKKKFGPYEIEVPWMRASRFEALAKMRNFAKTLVALKQKTFGLARQWKPS